MELRAASEITTAFALRVEKIAVTLSASVATPSAAPPCRRARTRSPIQLAAEPAPKEIVLNKNPD
jgi:hypothetical protein